MLITNVKPGKLRDVMSEGLVIIFPLYYGRQTLLMCLLYQSNKDACHAQFSYENIAKLQMVTIKDSFIGCKRFPTFA